MSDTGTNCRKVIVLTSTLLGLFLTACLACLLYHRLYKCKALVSLSNLPTTSEHRQPTHAPPRRTACAWVAGARAPVLPRHRHAGNLLEKVKKVKKTMQRQLMTTESLWICCAVVLQYGICTTKRAIPTCICIHTMHSVVVCVEDTTKTRAGSRGWCMRLRRASGRVPRRALLPDSNSRPDH